MKKKLFNELKDNTREGGIILRASEGIKMFKLEFEIPVFIRITNGKYLASKGLRKLPSILQLVADDFNDVGLDGYIDYKYEKLDNIKVISIRCVVDDKSEKLICKIMTNKKPNKGEIRMLLEFVNGQCSDGWGECFELKDFDPSKYYNVGFFPDNTMNISTWSEKKRFIGFIL